MFTKAPQTRCFFVFVRLLRNGSIHRANACAACAVDALLGVDDDLVITFGDRAGRALFDARAAVDAVVIDLESHDTYLLYIFPWKFSY